MTPKTAKKLLKLNHDLYEHQARCFSKTRDRGVWEKEIIDFVKKIPSNSTVLDLGCGNGRLYQLFAKKKIKYLGIDPSKQFIKMNQEKYPSTSLRVNSKFEVGDGLTMKFKNQFDYIISISVLHHIPSEELQLKFLKNIHQALKPNGKFLISVWNRWQSKYKKYFDNNYTKKVQHKFGQVPYEFRDLQNNDTIVPWMHSKYQRYIHLFKPAELKSLARKTGFKNIRVFASRHGTKTSLSKALNIYLIGKK